MTNLARQIRGLWYLQPAYLSCPNQIEIVDFSVRETENAQIGSKVANLLSRVTVQFDG